MAVPTLHPVPDAVTWLLGTWAVDRAIRDERAGVDGRFRGTATFAPPGAGSAALAPAPAGPAAPAGSPPPGSPAADPGGGAAAALADPALVLTWREEGRLAMPGHEGPAGRLLLVVRDAEGLEVRFDDGRPFHRLDLAGGRSSVVHPCRDDRYAGDLVVESDDAFVVAWTVRGPRKLQRITSRYDRRP